MKLKALFIALLVTTLSACISKPNRPDVSVLPERQNDEIIDQSAAEENTQAAVSKVILTDLESLPESTISTPVTAPPLSTTAIVPPPPVDLLERMRRGFELPYLESKYIAQQEHWNSTHNTYLKNLFNRATPFLYHIVEELDRRNLPMELALLPAIESAYRPDAVSRSRAGGLWQFIPSTGRSFGLRQDWWYDGRRDALASTKAALDYLTSLNKMFDGDWFLTLAAYNAGPGTVSRAIKANKKAHKGTRYQDLKLRLETRRYIPKLIALKNIINNPAKYNVTLPNIASRPYFKVVELNGQIDLKKFSDDAGIDQKDLRHLNAGFKRWATSPEGPHRLLIPLNAEGNVDHAKFAISQAPVVNVKSHRIAQGDSLSSIARKYGVSVSALQKTNGLRNSRIRAGKNLLVPVRGAPIAGGSNYSVSPHRSNASTHTVKRGDTLWSIARRYKVQVENLLAWNNLSANQVLSLDQIIKVIAN